MPHTFGSRTTSNRRQVRSPARRPPPAVRKPTTRRNSLLLATLPAGDSVRFRPEDVRVVRLRSRSGTVRGISFPSKPGDVAKVTEWMEPADRTADRKDIPDTRDGA